MRFEIRTLNRTISALLLVLIIGAGVDTLAQGRGRSRRHDNGRHLGWTNGRHRGWEHSSYYNRYRRNNDRDFQRDFRRRQWLERRAFIFNQRRQRTAYRRYYYNRYNQPSWSTYQRRAQFRRNHRY
jgi:hypothetical protein